MDEAKGKSWAALLLEVFTSPAKAFKEIAERPRFGAAGITLTIINLAFALLTLPKWREYSLMGWISVSMPQSKCQRMHLRLWLRHRICEPYPYSCSVTLGNVADSRAFVKNFCCCPGKGSAFRQFVCCWYLWICSSCPPAQ